MTGHHLGDLGSIEFTSGVNETRDGFVTVRAIGQLTDGSRVLLSGQMDLVTVRDHGLAALESAEAACTDAALVRMLEGLGQPSTAVAAFLLGMREERGGGDPT